MAPVTTQLPSSLPAQLAPKKPAALGQVPGIQPVGVAPQPVLKAAPLSGAVGGSRTDPTYNGAPSTTALQTALGGTGTPAPGGFSPVSTPPLTEGTATLGGPPPITGAPVAAAPFPVGKPSAPAAPSLEQTLTNQFQTGAPANPRLGATQGLVDQAAQGLSGGPDRTALAKQAFTDYLSQSGDQFNKDIRNITQRNAATGRLGSGMYGSDLVDAATAADKNRAYAGNQLAQDLANGTIQDQFGRVSALGGLEGQQFGEGQTALGNLENYGDTAFNHQLATQQQQQSLDDQQFRQLLATLGLNAG